MQNKYIIGPNFGDISNFAGTKYPNDVMRVCQNIGCKVIKIQEGYRKSNFYKVPIDIMKMFRLQRGDVVFYIDRICSSFSRRIVYYFAKKKKLKLIPILEDINVLREPSKNTDYELKLLNHAYMVISQNKIMSNYLTNNGVTTKIVSMGVLDFLSDKKILNSVEVSNIHTICYGGNLSFRQSGFVYKLRPSNDFKYKVYGRNLEKTIENSNVEYCGGFSENDCVGNIQGDWGLVWNGTSLEIKNNDSLATYYNYVTPHKFSMYALCGLPVIVYEKSAMASFVLENNCGIVINDLNEIEKKILEVSIAQYDEMKNNIIKIGKRAAKGDYLSNALSKILNEEVDKCLD